MKQTIEDILNSKIVVGNKDGIRFFVDAMEAFVREKQKEAAERAWDSGWHYGHADGADIIQHLEPLETRVEHLKQYER